MQSTARYEHLHATADSRIVGDTSKCTRTTRIHRNVTQVLPTTHVDQARISYSRYEIKAVHFEKTFKKCSQNELYEQFAPQVYIHSNGGVLYFFPVNKYYCFVDAHAATPRVLLSRLPEKQRRQKGVRRSLEEGVGGLHGAHIRSSSMLSFH